MKILQSIVVLVMIISSISIIYASYFVQTQQQAIVCWILAILASILAISVASIEF